MMESIAAHAMVLGKGFVRMLVGAATALAAILAVSGFAKVTGETGYSAVGEFLVSVLCMIAAIAGVYLMGGNCKRRHK